MKEKMRILVVEPVKRPYVKEIDHTLEEMQKVVGGSIQALYPFEDRVGLICNDESKILPGFLPNRALKDENGNVYDIIFGTFFIAGFGEEDFCSLDDDLIEKFHKYYEYPQLFGVCGSEEEKMWINETHPPIYTFHLWVLKDTEENKDYLFMSYRHLKKSGRKIKKADYEDVYDGICVGGENDHRIAENVYASLNTEKPADYHARTFSMGDILVLSDEDRNEKAYFCDTFGFVEVPEFLS